MFENIQIKFKLKYLIAIFLTPILSLGFLVAPAQGDWASHLVISAVQITEGDGKTNHDFIEIYNPTSNDINLKGYRLVKRTKIGTGDTSIKSWTDDTIIKAHSWRLWASSDDESYSLGIGADDATKQTIAPDNGIAIRLGALDTGEIIDSVAWGEAENIFKESAAAAALNASESLVRKPGTPNEGNGEDTNNNANDFTIVTNFIPRNSQSTAVPAIENPQLPDPALTPSPASSPATDAPVVRRRTLPQAEAGVDKEAVIGENIDFDGSDSFDPSGKSLILTWDFGDKTSAKGANVSHAYSAAGEYNVILKADNGENASEDALKVKIIAPEFSDKIILSEILPNPAGADKDGEWIELFNSGEARVNLRGWILGSSAKTSGKQYIFSGDNFIDAKSFLVVKRSESGLVLTNESGGVSLAHSPDKILSEVSYGAGKEGKSYAFIDNFWQWTDAPTPGKENSAKVLTAAVSEQKESGILAAGVSKNAHSPAENSNIGSETINNGAIKPVSIKNPVSQPIKSADIENYLDKLISEKVDSAISKAKANETDPQEKLLALADNIQEPGIENENKKSVCEDFCSENGKDISNSQKDVRNNPWFWGDIALSVMSLILVWRYQEVRKKIKQV